MGRITDMCWLDISIDDEPAGRIDIGLYGDVVPKITNNFKHLAIGDKGWTYNDKPMHYKGVKFHRIIQKFMMQGGDITHNNGFGGQNIYGMHTIEDEGFHLPHYRRGMVSMANTNKDSNKSQFFITFKNSHWLDNKNVDFGQVMNGYQVLDECQKAGQQQ